MVAKLIDEDLFNTADINCNEFQIIDIQHIIVKLAITSTFNSAINQTMAK